MISAAQWLQSADFQHQPPLFSGNTEDTVSHWAGGVAWSGLTVACDTRGSTLHREDVQGGDGTLVLWADVRYSSKDRAITWTTRRKESEPGAMMITSVSLYRPVSPAWTSYSLLSVVGFTHTQAESSYQQSHVTQDDRTEIISLIIIIMNVHQPWIYSSAFTHHSVSECNISFWPWQPPF